MDPRKTNWFGWIEVGKSTLQIIFNVVQIVSIASAATGIIFAYFSFTQWAIIFLGVAILFFGVVYIARTRFHDRASMFVNPTMWIERDEVRIKVFPDKRVVDRRYEFKATGSAERYRFKFRWSGSENVKVALEATDDALIRITSPKVQRSWHRYEVRFQNALKAGDRKSVILQYELPDRSGESEPYHLVSYGHVAGCGQLVFRLSFQDNLIARDVFLIEYDADWNVQKGLPIGIDADDHEFRIEVNPTPGSRYSIEWQEK